MVPGEENEISLNCYNWRNICHKGETVFRSVVP